MSARGRAGRSLLWSTNELLAHKKNVGEEARLLGDLDLIHRRRALATSGMKGELRRLRTDLKNVRTSTGHSVEALPPTPFRLHRERKRASIHILTVHHTAPSTSPPPRQRPTPSHALSSFSQLHKPGHMKSSQRQTPRQPKQPKRAQPQPPQQLQQPEHSQRSQEQSPCALQEQHFDGRAGPSLKRDDVSPTRLPDMYTDDRHDETVGNTGHNQKAFLTETPVAATDPFPSPFAKEPNVSRSEEENNTTTVVSPRNSKMEAPVKARGRRVSVEFTLPEVSAIKRYPSYAERRDSSVEPKPVFVRDKDVEEEEEEGEDPLLKTERSFFSALSRENSRTKLSAEAAGSHRGSICSRAPSTLPLARELTEMIESVRAKNQELLAVRTAAVTINSKSEREQREEEQHAQDQLKLLKAKLAHSQETRLPNTRYRCRTCVERLRDNARYRQSLKHGGKSQQSPTEESNDALVEAATRQQTTNECCLLNRLPVKDLDGNVISSHGELSRQKSNATTASSSSNIRGGVGFQYGGAEPEQSFTRPPRTGRLSKVKPKPRVTPRGGQARSAADNANSGDDSAEEETDLYAEVLRGKPQQQGYSRGRMQKLAEPKGGGTKHRLNVSGRVLRRQAEALRHPHEKTQMTEREQERLLRLQSKVRLFVALLQERQLPVGMVHIPQRDDIMYVDISHIG